MTADSYYYYSNFGRDSNKHTATVWKYTVIHPTILVVSHGKCGLRGQHTIKTFPTPRAARKYLRDQRKHKRQTGFVEQTYFNKHNKNKNKNKNKNNTKQAATMMLPMDRKTKQTVQAYVKEQVVDTKQRFKAPYNKNKKIVKKNTKAKRKIVSQRPMPKRIYQATSPYTKMGLAGHKAPNVRGGYHTNGKPTVDSGVAGMDPVLASRVKVHDTLHARLALVDPSINADKYYILQVLVDPQTKKSGSGTSSSSSSISQYYVFTRWGRTGSAGQAKLEGPLSDEPAAKRRFGTIFESKVGTQWSNAVPGTTRFNGKYEYLSTSVSNNPKASWYYYLDRDPLGKPDGWYPYDSNNSDQVEQLYSDYRSSNRADRLSTRMVHSDSSGFTYQVDLSRMTQTNTQSGTVRPIGQGDNGNPPPLMGRSSTMRQ